MTAEPDQIRRDIERTRANLSYDVDALAYKASPSRMVQERKQRVTGALRGIRDNVMGTAEGAGSSVSAAGGHLGDRASELGDKASEAMRSAGEAAAHAPETIRRQTEGNPLAVGLIAFGAGWLVSSLIPASATERRAVGQLKDVAQEHAGQLREELTHVAQDLKGNLEQPAREAMEAVTTTATDAAAAAKQDVADAAGEIRGKATQSARNVSP
ncbi:DUF3618 domain-containing protein [Pilimelia columellifera]|uniref:DUF3618 domain-containing protein n=1 Tax=Pilimelia columellifera subsp. columellifera TaxID=706583 RepID=A0ABN3MZN5_9ACTN